MGQVQQGLISVLCFHAHNKPKRYFYYYYYIIIIIGGGGVVVNFLMTLHWGEEWATGSKLHRHQMSDSDLGISDFPKVLRPLNKTTSLYFIFSISPTRVTPHRTFLAIFLAQFISIP